MNNFVLEAKHLYKTFGHGHTEVCAVDNVNMKIAPGELVLVMGPSGSGKTTFLSMLGGLLKPSKGDIFLDKQNISQLNETELSHIRALKIGFIFQAFNLLDALTAAENISLPAQLGQQSKAKTDKRVQDLINQLSLTHRQRALPKTLSGGEKQRVAIARALVNSPKVILADEPTGNLDSQSGQDVMMLLHDIAREKGVAVLIVTHDPRAEDIADKVLWLEDGKLRNRKTEKHLWVTDPVCGMRVDEWQAVHIIRHKNLQYTFCSRRCKEQFESHPDDYITAKA